MKQYSIMKFLKDYLLGIKEGLIFSVIVGFGIFIGFLIANDTIRDNNRLNELYIQAITIKDLYIHALEKNNDSLKIEINKLKRTELPVTIFTITRNNMQVVSSLGSEQDTFTKYHHYELKNGVNSDYVVLQEGQSFEWIITNY